MYKTGLGRKVDNKDNFINLKGFIVLPPDVKAVNKGDANIYIKEITILWHEGTGEFDGKVYREESQFFKAYEQISNLEREYIAKLGFDDNASFGYTKTKVLILFQDGLTIEWRLDVGKNDFVPYFAHNLSEYYDKILPPEYLELPYKFSFNQKFDNPNFGKMPVFKADNVAKKAREDAEKKEKEGVVGKNYDSKLDSSAIAKRVKDAIQEKYDGCKVSITVDKFSGGRSIDISIKDFGFNPFTKEYLNSLNIEDYKEQVDIYNSKAEKIEKDCSVILESYNFDKSDRMTDYFFVNFYSSVSIDRKGLIAKYAADTDTAKINLARLEKEKAEKAKLQQENAAKKKSVKFAYGDVCKIEINYRNSGKKDEYCLIEKAPNGQSFFGTYSISILRLADENKVANGLKKEADILADGSYYKKVRNKPIWIVYIEGKPYSENQRITGITEERLKIAENWKHYLKESKPITSEKGDVNGFAKVQIQIQQSQLKMKLELLKLKNKH